MIQLYLSSHAYVSSSTRPPRSCSGGVWILCDSWSAVGRAVTVRSPCVPRATEGTGTAAANVLRSRAGRASALQAGATRRAAKGAEAMLIDSAATASASVKK